MPDDRQDRADRILDAAADLLVGWGYRRVTIDEVARRAQVGKGTVYLHWRSRDELFLAVITREGSRLLADLAQAIEDDPRELQLHRYLRRIAVGTLQRPLLRGVFTRDVEMLGKLVGTSSGTGLAQDKMLLSQEYFGLLQENNLLPPDLTELQLSYAGVAILLGYLIIEPLVPTEMSPTDEEKVDALTKTLTATLAPKKQPSRRLLQELAPKVVAMFRSLATTYDYYTYRDPQGDNP